MTAEQAITAAFAVFIALPAVYLAFLAGLTLLPRPSPPRDRAPGGLLRFAILVPAHDEELMIGRTAASLLRLDYPRDRFSVHVVADNCVDATAALARRHGACVHERSDPLRRGKGAALNWLVEQVAAEVSDADAVVVVDADSELSPNFLWVMTHHLRAGAQAVQALNLVAVSEDRPLVRIRELAFELGCHLRPLAHEMLGASSGLYGNGMCFSAALCGRYRWNESSVTEDAELFLRLVRDGNRVVLATDATARSVMPATLRDAGSQAVRWERGRFDHSGAAARLLWTGLRRRDPNSLFTALSALTPPIAVLATASGLGLAAGLTWGAPPLVAFAAGSLSCLVFYALRGATLGGMAPSVVLRILLCAPLYSLWKVWVIALAAIGEGRGAWTRTTRVT